jgi:hypothetical protein
MIDRFLQHPSRILCPYAPQGLLEMEAPWGSRKLVSGSIRDQILRMLYATLDLCLD